MNTNGPVLMDENNTVGTRKGCIRLLAFDLQITLKNIQRCDKKKKSHKIIDEPWMNDLLYI